jgi:hypothetical protein
MLAGLGPTLLVVLATVLVATGCVLVHFLGLSRLNGWLTHAHTRRRSRPLVAVLVALCLHLIEILLFGVSGWLLSQWPDLGGIRDLSGIHSAGFSSALYLSTVSFSTVGFGEIVPFGALRILYSVEGLVGLTLISWSASYTYIEMERDWRH